jgi:hypothetical protein
VFEAFCLNIFGVTFGKFLYGIRLTRLANEQISLAIAFKRSLAVWVRGLGLGIPIVALFTLITAYRTLMKDRQTTWDRDFECAIIHRNFTLLRGVIVTFVWALVIATYVLLTTMQS